MSSPAPRSPGRELFLRLGMLASLLVVSLFFLSQMREQFATRKPSEVVAAENAFKGGDSARAKTILDQYVNAHKGDVQAYLFACQVSSGGEHWDWMRDYANAGVQACKDAPDSARAALYSVLAQAFSQLETVPNQPQTIAAAQRALELDPDNPEMLNGLGYVLADNNQHLDQARSYLTKALRGVQQLPNDRPEVRNLQALIEDSYGWLLYRQGDYGGAASVLAQAVSDISNPEDIGKEMRVVYYHLGAAQRKAGKTEEARRALESALAYDPTYAPARTELSLLPPAPSKPQPAPTPNTAAPPSATIKSFSRNIRGFICCR